MRFSCERATAGIMGVERGWKGVGFGERGGGRERQLTQSTLPFKRFPSKRDAYKERNYTSTVEMKNK